MATSRSDIPYVKPVNVYVTNYGYHDYKAATRYGRIIAVTRGNVDFRNTDRLRANILAALETMQEDDFILLSGPNIIVAEVIAAVMAKFGKVRYLYHEQLYSDYLERNTNGRLPEDVSEPDDRRP